MVESLHLACGLHLIQPTKRLASRGGRNRSSTRLPVLGRQLQKGGLHQPPFSFPRHIFRDIQISLTPTIRSKGVLRLKLAIHPAGGTLILRLKKSERPVGGPAARAWDGGYVIRSQFGLSGRSTALASSRTTHRSRQVTTVAILQKDRTTPDYLASLRHAEVLVDSSADSFFTVLPASTDDRVLVRKYFRQKTFGECSAKQNYSLRMICSKRVVSSVR
jgi:hypothetical protein